jgi:hypothetical protein
VKLVQYNERQKSWRRIQDFQGLEKKERGEEEVQPYVTQRHSHTTSSLQEVKRDLFFITNNIITERNPGKS